MFGGRVFPLRAAVVTASSDSSQSGFGGPADQGVINAWTIRQPWLIRPSLPEIFGPARYPLSRRSSNPPPSFPDHESSKHIAILNEWTQRDHREIRFNRHLQLIILPCARSSSTFRSSKQPRDRRENRWDDGVQHRYPYGLSEQEPSLLRPLRCIQFFPGQESKAGALQPRHCGNGCERCVETRTNMKC